jgi:hypothetical protein
MSADEKLATGLTNRFFREVRLQVSGTRDSLQKSQIKSGSSVTQWMRSVAELRDRYRGQFLNEWQEERKNKSFWCATFLDPRERSELKQRDERVLSISYLRWRLGSAGPRLVESPIVELSSHVVKRIFMRSSVGYSPDSGYSVDGLREELRAVAPFAAMWEIFLINAPESEVIFPIIPTRSGFLLCEAIKLETSSGQTVPFRLLSARTFVSKKEMYPGQLQLHQEMTRVFEKIKGIPVFVATPFFIDSVMSQQYLAYCSLANICMKYLLTKISTYHDELAWRLLDCEGDVVQATSSIGIEVLKKHFLEMQSTQSQIALFDENTMSEGVIKYLLRGARKSRIATAG